MHKDNSRITTTNRVQASETMAQAMKKLLHVFSHDLRNPLLNIQALSQELQMSVLDAKEASEAAQGQTLADILNEDLPDTISLLQESTQRMDGMIAGINDIYHCMYDALACEEVAMQLMFERCFALLKLEDEGLGLRCNAAVLVEADPWAVKRVVSELLLNAARAMRGVKQTLPRDIVVNAHQTGDFITLQVRDAGCGFADSEIEQVFEPFFSGQAFKECAGLGLSRNKALIEQHGGLISVENIEGGGMVTFSLPRS